MLNQAQTILPASLLVEGKDCLIAGGGKVANRKAVSLIAANAKVTIIAPKICAGLRELASNQQVAYIPRRVNDDDINEQGLVFAGTDEPNVNKQLLDSCREKRVLCCCIDNNWRQGDFVSPAAFSHNGVTISVSTGGRSCTEARDIKNAIMEFLKKMETMTGDEQPAE